MALQIFGLFQPLAATQQVRWSAYKLDNTPKLMH